MALLEAIISAVEGIKSRYPGIAESIANNTTDRMTYDEWKAELITITARATGQSERQIKINDAEARKYCADGFTPYQCFRETWDMENDNE